MRDSSRRRRAIVAVLLIVIAVPVVLALEAAWAITRPRLAADPGFDVSQTVGDDRSGPPFVLHVLGNSTIAGVGVDRASDSLPVMIASEVSEALDRPVRLAGHGVSGAVTDDIQRQLDEVPNSGVDAIVIEVGSNDVTHRTGLDDLEVSTRRMLEDAQDRSPIVVLGSSGKLNTPNFLQPLRWVVMRRATAVRARQERVARQLDVAFVDVAREVAPEFERIGPSANSSDGFHPSAKGYAAWAVPLAERVIASVEDRRSG